ncbi:hypothetical protein ES703_87663 [subsurface metagenome]
MCSMIPSSSPAGILERHIEVKVRSDGVVTHKLDGVLGPFLLIHSQARIGECQFCQALGVNGWRSLPRGLQGGLKGA